jgi:hypothetical protein
MPKTVGVDFDGVIHDYKEGWKDGSIYGELIPGALSSLSYLMREYAVFIHSTRDAAQILTWMRWKTDDMIPITTVLPEGDFWSKQGIILVTNRKFPAIAYIDDRAIRFENWIQAIDDLEQFS